MENALDLNAIRASFAVAAHDPDLMMRFYARLFERHPQLRRLFERVMPVQSEMLLRAIHALLTQLEEEPRMTRNHLRALGVRHLGYGVSDEMYAWFGDAFIDSLAEALGTSWTLRIEIAWKEAYSLVAAMMVEGAELSGVPTLRAAS